jgi:hypothetical protein
MLLPETMNFGISASGTERLNWAELNIIPVWRHDRRPHELLHSMVLHSTIQRRTHSHTTKQEEAQAQPYTTHHVLRAPATTPDEDSTSHIIESPTLKNWPT